MTRMRWVAGLSLILAGCTSGDPGIAVLAAGTEAVVVGDIASNLDCPGDFVMLDPGTRVRIGHDSGVYQETAEDVERLTYGETDEQAKSRRLAGPQKYTSPDPVSGYRRVRVVVESGPHQGKAGTITRRDLRPIPR